MTAPAFTARVEPNGIRLDDGYQTLFAFAADPDVALWEKTVKPPGMDGGDAIETTTMHNDTWRSFSSRALKTLTPMSGTAAYDPVVYEQLNALINVETAITVHFPDGSQVAFYGFLQTFEPDENSEGEQPQGSFTITPTNIDPATGGEEGPVLGNVTGT